MEDVLNLYEQPYDPYNPLICFDERPCQLIDDVLQPLPMKEGQPKREDYHYERKGTCNVFIALQPHTGQRLVAVYKQKTHKEYADFFQRLSQHYSDAATIPVVQDNLSTHSPTSFYKRFKAEEAFELTQEFQMHYTPKNASWLNMQKPTHSPERSGLRNLPRLIGDFVLAAEIELSALSKQCLDRRIGDMETLNREVQAWASYRNRKGIKVKWQFTNENARDKFKRFYPKLS